MVGSVRGKPLAVRSRCSLCEFMRTIGNKMAHRLSSCTHSMQTTQRRQVLLSLVQLVYKLANKDDYVVDGCGPYKCKRILDMTILAGLSPKLAVPHLVPGDLTALCGYWPVPFGSRHGLRQIMPGMTTKRREQQALKAIALAIGSGGSGKSVPVCTISAMLCFWNEHKNHVLQWVPEWIPKVSKRPAIRRFLRAAKVVIISNIIMIIIIVIAIKTTELSVSSPSYSTSSSTLLSSSSS